MLRTSPVPMPTASPPGLDRWFAEQGTPLPIDLARSGAASLTLAELLNLTGKSVEDVLGLSLDYGAGRGSHRLQAAVRDSLVATGAAEVVIASGAVEALLLLCLATGGRGEVLVGSPAYGALVKAPATAGRVVRAVPVWRPVAGLGFDRLVETITSATGMVVVNSPHNPSGAQASPEQLDALAERCERHGALLVVDEVARGTLDPAVRSAAGSRGFARGNTVVLGDVSKSLGLGGLRIGWMATADPALAAAVAAAKDGTTVASSSLSEHLAVIALENRARLLRRTRSAAQANLEALSRLLADRGDAERWTRPTDGLVAFPSVTAPAGIDALVGALRRLGVGVVPGALFGEPDRVRLGLGGHPHLFADGLGRLEQALGGW